MISRAHVRARITRNLTAALSRAGVTALPGEIDGAGDLRNAGKGTVGMPAPGRGGLPCIRPLSLFVSLTFVYVHKATE